MAEINFFVYIFLFTAQPTSGNTTVINDEENNMQPQNTIRPNINSEDLTWKKLLINMLNHLLVISVTIFVAYKSFQHGIVLFAWHPPLMVLGVLILYIVRVRFFYYLFLFFLVFYLDD